MTFQIEVARDLSLKLREKKDARAFFELVEKNREEFEKWFPWVHTTTSITDTEFFILECREGFVRGRDLDLGVLYKDQWIGSMGFHTINTKHYWAEIGYWLDADFVGKGIMTACVKAIINHGFNELSLHRIQIRCNSLNLRSKAIPERLGFALEGVLKEDHFQKTGYSDGLIYGLLKQEWHHG